MRKQAWLVLFCIFIVACGSNSSKKASGEGRLVIVLCVDQMLPDYFDLPRFHYTGGLKRLFTEGTFYSNADLNYANTVTAPGHTTLSTGVYPSTSGVTNNSFVSRANEWSPAADDPASNALEGSGHVSPRKLLVSAVGDWLLAKSPRSKVISIAGKDRSAIFMGGRKPTRVYWYDATVGHMVTSIYYEKSFPDWIKRFNASEHTSFEDGRILDCALQAIRSEALGQRGVADLLFAGLSATDYVGHAHGTESPEMHDQLVQLDQSVGLFLSEVEKILGKRFIVVLTADHGALRFAKGKVNFDQSILPAVLKLDQQIQKEWSLKKPFIQMEGADGGFLDYESANANHIDIPKLQQNFREAMIKIDGINDVYFRNELSSSSTPLRPFLERYRNSYYPPREMDFLIRFCEKCLIYSGSPPPTQHGSPYSYDSHIPLLFWGDKIPRQQIARPVYMVDVAPTIATFLNTEYPSSVNGKPLGEVLPK